ncbi:MAG: NUDIX hydrolase [Candidatus Micrarchaeota archaeon]|nr:NUDIX hydrolase [Candidatus Micrarchaeota archaeon]
MAKTLYNDKWMTITEHVVNIRGRKVKIQRYRQIDVVVILPVLDDGNFIMERQYRYGINKYLTEFPAGLIEKGEKPIDAARRELEEETGYKAGKIRLMFKEFYNPAMSSRVYHYFVAEKLKKSKRHLDRDEIINVVKVSPKRVEAMIKSRKLIDHKSIASYLYYGNYIAK